LDIFSIPGSWLCYNPPITIPLVPLSDYFPEYSPEVILKRGEQYNISIASPLSNSSSLFQLLVAKLQDQAGVEYIVVVDTGMRKKERRLLTWF
jgi:hypothetical protein